MLQTEILRSRGGFQLDLPHAADFAAWAPLLFDGNVGFVNEACATAYFHDSSETARLSIAQVFSDGRKVTDLVSRMAEEHIKTASLREELKLQARRCFSRRALVCLADHRRNGASLFEIFKFMWHFRTDLTMVNKLSVLKCAAIVLCPRLIADRLRYLSSSPKKVGESAKRRSNPAEIIVSKSSAHSCARQALPRDRAASVVFVRSCRQSLNATKSASSCRRTK